MNVLHINTYFEGGAARAAIRLHHALGQQGINSKMLFLFAPAIRDEKFFGYLDVNELAYSQHIEEKNAQRLTAEKRKYGIQEALNCEMLTFPTTSFVDLHEHPLVREADIIHLHWIARLIDYPSFFQKIKKPVVWTLHDLNPMQGLFHYEADLKNNHCVHKYDQELMRLKARAIRACDNLTVVTPSGWLQKKARQTKAFASFPTHSIANSVDVDRYRILTDKKIVRKCLALPENRVTFLFVCANSKMKRKRFDLFCAAAEVFQDDQRIHFCCVGNVAAWRAPANITSLGEIKNELFLPLVYNCADATCVLSDEDNLPNVILESMACGVPVIGVPNGGIQEYIDEVTGIRLKDNTVQSLAESVTAFVEGRTNFSAPLIRARAKEYFSQEKQAEAYLQVYKQSLNAGCV
jgi:glycosyltransferase involved in cell wall biosynthesis